jgi:UDP-N-acetylglucosamine 2-epimerase (non-hydrolysing)
MLLVGTDTGRIVETVVRLIDPAVRAAMSRRAFPYGDGHATERIAGHIGDFLAANAPGEQAARRA